MKPFKLKSHAIGSKRKKNARVDECMISHSYWNLAENNKYYLRLENYVANTARQHNSAITNHARANLFKRKLSFHCPFSGTSPPDINRAGSALPIPGNNGKPNSCEKSDEISDIDRNFVYRGYHRYTAAWTCPVGFCISWGEFCLISRRPRSISAWFFLFPFLEQPYKTLL